MNTLNILKIKLDHIINTNKFNSVDYVGINIENSPYIKYKIYYVDTHAMNNAESMPFKSLIKKELVSFVCPVDDNNNLDIDRYDLKLKERSNIPINVMLQEFSNVSTAIKNNLSEIYEIAKMKVIEEENFDYASLYFVGVLLKNKQIEAMKFHFMTRRQTLHENVYDNNYYIDYLHQLDIYCFNTVLKIGQDIIESELGNLHLIGVDYFEDSTKKYKIYIKNTLCTVNQLADQLGKYSIKNIQSIIDTLKEVKLFFNDYPTLYFDGLSLCCDTNDIFSVNLYFKFVNI